jgi:hypothetical protein
MRLGACYWRYAGVEDVVFGTVRRAGRRGGQRGESRGL